MDKFIIIGGLVAFGLVAVWILVLVRQKRKYKNMAIARKAEAEGLRRENKFLSDLQKGGSQNVEDRLDDIDALVNDLDPRKR